MIVAYTLMNLAKHSYWAFFSFFALVYLTDVAGVQPEVAGAIILASLVFDATLDIAAGALIERWRSQLRDYQPIILSGAALSAACMTLFFAAHLLGFGLAAIVAVLLAFRAGFTVYDLCDNALASRITPLPEQRTVLSAWRKAGAACASMAVGASLGFILEDAVAAQTRVPLFAAFIALSAFVTAALGYRALRELDRAAPAMATISLLGSARGLMQSRGALALSGLALIESIATLTLIGGLIYFARAAFDGAGWAGAATIAFTVAQVISLPFWTWLARHSGKHKALALSHGATAIACAGFAAMASISPTVAWLAVAAIGAAISGVSTMRWSIAPDLMDRAGPGGVRLETSIAGLVSGAVQVGAGLSAATLGWLLAHHGYQAHTPSSLEPDQFALALGIVGAIGHSVCAVFALRWSLMRRAPT